MSWSIRGRVERGPGELSCSGGREARDTPEGLHLELMLDELACGALEEGLKRDAACTDGHRTE